MKTKEKKKMRKLLEVCINEEAEGQYKVQTDFRNEKELADTIRVLVTEMAENGMEAETLKSYIQQIYDHTDIHYTSDYTAS